MTLTFYTNPMSRGRIARWMLEEVGAPYETVVLDYASSMKGAAYLAVNPMGKVPAIVHDGRVVTEGAAICAYLAEAFPEAGLAPTADERADYYRWLFYAAGPVEAAVTNRSLGVVPTDDQQRMVGYGSFDTMLDTLEAAVSAHPFIAGDRFTAADVYVGSQVMWGQMFGSMPKRDAFLAYGARLAEREAYTRAAAIDDALIAKPA
ncbi:glutathione S-transferase family protein [Sphingomonas ginsenosidivorax]|uniref:Glutathione S-transferase family protein n=1 Tax=Sphingomonas ginsenosidivorax TaxID=862135 RepID=A0A5C6UHE9_9SPHN|nr:glutathione S-transferase family protein [Sphingomonas ginsenosidivorax]TXC71626.1 glutathione S-transferase family protein [Sphingomonas ginsenosidivorax]